jgi:hypothetical protein
LLNYFWVQKENAMSITTQVVASSVADLSARGSTPTERQKVEIRTVQRRKDEDLLVSQVGTVCPVNKLKDDQRRLASLRPEEFKNLLQSNFYNADVMRAAMCTTESIFYMNPVSMNVLSSNDRVREWIKKPHQIGAESVEGVALASSLDRARDVFILKAPRNNNQDNLAHEAAVGMFGLNPLRGKVPNFAYILGAFKCSPPILEEKEVVAFCDRKTSTQVNYVIYENIVPSVPMSDYCKNCNITQFLDKFLQVVFALRTAHQSCDFTHYDLHSGNVLVKKIDSVKFSIPYATDKGKEYLQTDSIATIIDYGMCHFVYNNKHYGTYGLSAYGVQGDSSFPMHDIYKFLCSCLQVMYEAGNQTTFKEAGKILQFFNMEETPEMIITRQSQYYYALPALESTLLATHDQFLGWLRTNFRLPFLRPTAGVERVLGCYGTDNCITYGQAVHKIGLDRPVEASDMFEFYDLMTQYKREGQLAEYNDLLNKFTKRYPFAQKSYIDEYNAILQNIMTRLKTFSIVSVTRTPLEVMLTLDYFLMYKHHVVELAILIELLERISLMTTIITYTAELYSDTATANSVKINENALRQQAGIVEKARQSFREDLVYLQTIPQDVTKWNYAFAMMKQIPTLSWYWQGIDTFRYLNY